VGFLFGESHFMHSAFQALLGGVLIGLASWLLLASTGKVAGISGIASGLLSQGKAWRWAFMVALVAGGALCTLWLAPPQGTARSPVLLVGAGLLVGFGTVLGSGCTSGHGVCGLGRRSVRSLVAVLVFMATGMATVFTINLIAA
jgi:uncharacterized protein